MFSTSLTHSEQSSTFRQPTQARRRYCCAGSLSGGTESPVSILHRGNPNEGVHSANTLRTQLAILEFKVSIAIPKKLNQNKSIIVYTRVSKMYHGEWRDPRKWKSQTIISYSYENEYTIEIPQNNCTLDVVYAQFVDAFPW